jgi:hypothetical protein
MGFQRLLALYRRHFRDHRRERMVLASASFFVTFGASRMVVYGGRNAVNPFEMWIGGIHVHHYVWGILLLLVVGYLWLIQVGTGARPETERFGRITLLYGGAAALTLDEFALWLHLDDVYWERTGRMSIDAVMLFGALVSAGLWGGPFWRALLRQGARVWRRRSRPTQDSGRAEAAPLASAAIPVVLCPTCGRVPDRPARRSSRAGARDRGTALAPARGSGGRGWDRDRLDGLRAAAARASSPSAASLPVRSRWAGKRAAETAGWCCARRLAGPQDLGNQLAGFVAGGAGARAVARRAFAGRAGGCAPPPCPPVRQRRSAQGVLGHLGRQRPRGRRLRVVETAFDETRGGGGDPATCARRGQTALSLDPDGSSDVTQRRPIAIGGREGLVVDSWDRLSHARERRIALVLNQGHLLAVRTEWGDPAPMKLALDAVLTSLQFESAEPTLVGGSAQAAATR